MNKLRLQFNEAVVIKGDTKYLSYKGKYYKYDASGKHEIEQDEYLKVLGKAKSKTKTSPKEASKENSNPIRDLVVPVSEREKAPKSTEESIEENLDRMHDVTVKHGKRTTVDTMTIKGQDKGTQPHFDFQGNTYYYDTDRQSYMTYDESFNAKKLSQEEYEKALSAYREEKRSEVVWEPEYDGFDEVRAAVESVFDMSDLNPRTKNPDLKKVVGSKYLAHYYGGFAFGEDRNQGHLSEEAWDSLIGKSGRARAVRNFVNRYTGSEYRDIRADPEKSKMLNDMIESVSDVAGYDKGPLFRGITLTKEELLPMLYEGAEIDMLDAPSSWSTNYNTSKKFSDSSDEERIGVVFVECHTPKKSAVSVRALSHFDSECECLYSGNQRWKVVSARSVIEHDDFEETYQTKIVIEVQETNHPVKVKRRSNR